LDKDEIRKAFEKWAVSLGYSLCKIEGIYVDFGTWSAFEGFQAAQEEIMQLKENLAECLVATRQRDEAMKDAARWKAIVDEAERDYVEVPAPADPYWQRLECAAAMEEWVDAAIKGASGL
jgi:hypothetical protein